MFKKEKKMEKIDEKIEFLRMVICKKELNKNFIIEKCNLN